MRNRIASLYETADGWALRDTGEHEQSRFVQRRIEGREAPARVVGWQVQLVAQAQIERELSGKLPVVLNEEVVIVGTQTAVGDAVGNERGGRGADKESTEAGEIQEAMGEHTGVKIILVVTQLRAGA